MCPASRSPLHLYNLIINQASHFTSLCVSKTAESDWEIYFKLSCQILQSLSTKTSFKTFLVKKIPTFILNVRLSSKVPISKPAQISLSIVLKKVKLPFTSFFHMHWADTYTGVWSGGPQFNPQLRREPMPSLQCPRSTILQRPSLKQVHL